MKIKALYANTIFKILIFHFLFITCEKKDNIQIKNVECLLTKVTYIYEGKDDIVYYYEYNEQRKLIKRHEGEGYTEVIYDSNGEISKIIPIGNDKWPQILYKWTSTSLTLTYQFNKNNIWENSFKVIYELNDYGFPISYNTYHFQDDEWVKNRFCTMEWLDGNFTKITFWSIGERKKQGNGYDLKECILPDSIIGTYRYKYDTKKNAILSLGDYTYPRGLNKNNIQERIYNNTISKRTIRYNKYDFPVEVTITSNSDNIVNEPISIIYEYSCLND